MTYKLNYFSLVKIISPVTLVFPGGEKCHFASGKEICNQIFDENYKIDYVRANDSNIEIYLKVSSNSGAGFENEV